jgi:hypothetical protein
MPAGPPAIAGVAIFKGGVDSMEPRNTRRNSEHRPVRGLSGEPPEMELARREPMFPGLAVLLDPELFCGLVRMHAADADPGAGRLIELRYRPGVTCTATYAFRSAAGETWVHARALQPNERVPPGDESDPSACRSPLGFGRASWPDYGLVVRAFPCDDEIPGLAALATPESLAQLLTEVLRIPDPEGLAVRTIAYEPERRWLGAVEEDRFTVAGLRIHAPKGFPRARWNTESLHDGEGLRFARVLGRSREHCATAFDWVTGRSLEHVLFDPFLHRVEVQGVGAAIAELHAQEPGHLPHCPLAVGAAGVRELAATLGFVLPRCAPRARRLADRLVRRLVEGSDADGAIHGRLEPDKLMLQGGGRVVVLDLDRACQGPVARDPGTLLGHLERAVVAGELHQNRADWVAHALLEGYDRTAGRPLRRRDVSLHAALTLFQLALRPFRRLQPEWPNLTIALLDRAEEVLTSPPL